VDIFRTIRFEVRDLNLFPPSFTTISQRWVLPLSGSTICPPDQRSSERRKPQRMRNPINGWSFITPSHCVHRGFGSRGWGGMRFSMVPYNVPFSSQRSTTEVTFPSHRQRSSIECLSILPIGSAERLVTTYAFAEIRAERKSCPPTIPAVHGNTISPTGGAGKIPWVMTVAYARYVCVVPMIRRGSRLRAVKPAFRNIRGTGSKLP
jgi:hypothetical protein